MDEELYGKSQQHVQSLWGANLWSFQPLTVTFPLYIGTNINFILIGMIFTVELSRPNFALVNLWILKSTAITTPALSPMSWNGFQFSTLDKLISEIEQLPVSELCTT